jgi:hypothetical protein
VGDKNISLGHFVFYADAVSNVKNGAGNGVISAKAK